MNLKQQPSASQRQHKCEHFDRIATEFWDESAMASASQAHRFVELGVVKMIQSSEQNIYWCLCKLLMWRRENKKDTAHSWTSHSENFFGMVAVKTFNFVGYCVDLQAEMWEIGKQKHATPHYFSNYAMYTPSSETSTKRCMRSSSMHDKGEKHINWKCLPVVFIKLQRKFVKGN